jgi:uncharacterized protein with ParB-like and HNH nuclease domain
MKDEDLWVDDYSNDEEYIEIEEYDITSTPNDFNVITLFNFVESGAVIIPGFQRNYVWDRARASKLIESLILGLPVPQLFLYEKTKNKFLVIDGQQRLMSIYYFLKKRFPRKDKRTEIRIIFDKHGRIPDNVLDDDSYFEDFRLKLSERLPEQKNKFNKLNYTMLGEHKLQLELRPIRNIVVRQNDPTANDSAVYEIFNRLNSGGVNLTPQEIRASMYHSPFYDMLSRVNRKNTWRAFLPKAELDLHMKDTEILLRGFAMLIDGKQYSPSMVKFLNSFSKRCEKYSQADIDYYEALFNSFLESIKTLPANTFRNRSNNRFNLALYEAVFTATCNKAVQDQRLLNGFVSEAEVAALSTDESFINAASKATTQTSNVNTRLERAKTLLTSL